MAALAVAAMACSSPAPGAGERRPIRVAYLQDLTVPSHLDLVSPSFLAFDLALHASLERAGVDLEVEVVQMDTEGDPQRGIAAAEEVAGDPSYIAAVSAPFWAEPEAVGEILARAGVPTLSLSPQSAQPSVPSIARERASAGLWRRFVPDGSLEVQGLAEVIERAAASRHDPSPVCLFGEPWSFSRDLLRSLEETLPSDLARIVPPVGDDVEAAVVDVGRRCGLVVWTGGPDGAVRLASALHDAGAVDGRAIGLATEALKTAIPPTVPNHEGVVVGALTCPCVDVSTRRSLQVRAFVNAYQAAHGLVPGIYAAEAWDAARVLAGYVLGGARDRGEVAARLAGLRRFRGVARDYAFDGEGERETVGVELYTAAGSRWLRLGDYPF